MNGNKSSCNGQHQSSNHRFGELVTVKKHQARGVINVEPAVLDSGASVEMFCQPCEAADSTFRSGSKDKVELAAGSTSTK